MNVKNDKNDYFISVIVPVYNDYYGLKTTIESLIKQDYPDDNYEVIIGDNESDDGTQNLVANYSLNYKNIKYTVEKDVKTSYANRNRAMEKVNGSIIAFMDADMYVDTNWLSKINDYFKNHDTEYLGCHVELFSLNNTYSSLYNRATGFPIKKYIEQENYAPTCCLVIRSYIVDKIGNFNSELVSTGDWEYGQRAYRNGVKIAYTPDIVMYHPTRTSFKQLIKKSFRIGKGFHQVHYYHPEVENRLHEHLRNLFYRAINKLKKKVGLNVKEVEVKDPSPIQDTQIWIHSTKFERFMYFMIDNVTKVFIVLGYYCDRFDKIMIEQDP